MENTIDLLKSQKNKIFEVLKKRGFDPSTFKWTIKPSELTLHFTVSRLEYNDSGYFYQFDRKIGGSRYETGEYAYYCPGSDKKTECEYVTNWEGHAEAFINWMSYLDREINEPDLWEEISKQGQLFGHRIEDGVDNHLFNVQQYEQIQSGITQIKHFLLSNTNSDKDQEDIILINTKLDYLIDAAKRQGRRDWFHTCIGVIVTLSTALALAPEQTTAIWAILKGALTGVIRLLPK